MDDCREAIPSNSKVYVHLPFFEELTMEQIGGIEYPSFMIFIYTVDPVIFIFTDLIKSCVMKQFTFFIFAGGGGGISIK